MSVSRAFAYILRTFREHARVTCDVQVALSIYELHGTSALNLLTRAADMGGFAIFVQLLPLGPWAFGLSSVYST